MPKENQKNGKFPLRKIKEGNAEIFIPEEQKISKKLLVFYNPVMKFNRDTTILLLKQFPPLQLCDPLAGTGIRSIRFAKELKNTSITANDINKKAGALIKKNMKQNKVKFIVKNQDANLLLLESSGFDFIDLDVFGSPNFLLDSAIRRLSRRGLLALTATDTAPLCGTYPDACRRKYWANPLRNELMHEVGLRILIRKAQLIGTQYDRALTPVFSYSKDHYMRAILSSEKSKHACDAILKQHQYFLYCKNCLDQETSQTNNKICEECKTPMVVAGPFWTGQLNDKELVTKMAKEKIEDKETKKFLEMLSEESQQNNVGFIDLHTLSRKTKRNIPKMEDAIKKLKDIGFTAVRTHFSQYAVKTNATAKQFTRLFAEHQ